MKKEVIVLDLYNSARQLLIDHPEWFKLPFEYEDIESLHNDNNTILYVTQALAYIILELIDKLTKHKSKISADLLDVTEYLSASGNREYAENSFEEYICDHLDNVFEFLLESEWNTYAYNKDRFTLTIIKGDDWRALEYERIQLDKELQKEIDLDKGIVTEEF